MNSYQNLCAEFYDITKPEAPSWEVSLYTKHLKGIRGPILEAMCGSGRLLIPLLKAGYIIEGVDNSSSMLKNCRERINKLGLKTTLYEQSVENLTIEKRYGAIIVAVGSFQLLADRAQALQALQSMYAHLMPNGLLLIDTFIPWDEICATINLPIKRTAIIDSQTYIDLKTNLQLNRDLQQCHINNHYQKIKDGIIINTEDENLIITWYYRYEMELFLQKAGFVMNAIHEHKDGLLYEARKN